VRRSRLAAGLIGALILALPPRAGRAQPAPSAPSPLPPSSVEEARRLFKEAVALTDVERWDDALVRFEEAAQLVPDKADITFNIARCEKSLGRYTRARALFMKALDENRQSRALEPDEIADATRFLSEIDPKILHITVTLERGDVTVLVDGRPLERAEGRGGAPLLVAGTKRPSDGEAPPAARFELMVDPGTHVFTVGRKGVSTVVTRTLAPGWAGTLALRAPEDPPQKRLPRYELVPMYLTTTIWGAGTGFTIEWMTKGSATASPYRAIGYGLGASAAGIGALLLVDHLGHPLAYGVPQSITAGLGIGLEGGVFLAALTLPPSASSGGEIFSARGGVMIGTSVAGAVVGGLLGETLGTSPARSAAIFSGAVWGGMLIGFTGGGTVGAVSGSNGAAGTRAATAIGGIGGMVIGSMTAAVWAKDVTPSFSRVYSIDAAGLAGGVTGLLLPVVGEAVFKTKCQRPACPDPNLFDLTPFSLLGTAIGTAIGLTIGIAVTRHMDPEVIPETSKTAGVFALPILVPTRGGGTIGLEGTF
jgi:Tetratricopeptide repeat